MKGYFVTGTDTGVGKTLITAGLIQWLASQNFQVAGMKPVASGCEFYPQEKIHQLKNDDALKLMAQSNMDLPYQQVNPYAFAPAIAPHIAAQQSEIDIDLTTIEECYQSLENKADVTLVEGVGGWHVPLNSEEKVMDLAVRLKLPVILVCGMRLGCINHTLLTAESIRNTGVELIACVASVIDPGYQQIKETKDVITQELKLPVDVVPNLQHTNSHPVAEYLDNTKKMLNETI